MNFHPERSIDLLEELQERWHVIRPGILSAAVTEGNEELQTALTELARDVHNSLNSTAWIASDLSTHSGLGHESIKVARGDHKSANQKLDKISTLLRAPELN